MRFVVLSALLVSSIATAEPLTLTQLIARARANDHRVKEAEAQLRFYRSKYDEARWVWFPKLDSYFLVAGPTPEAHNNALGGPPTTAASYMYDWNFGQPGVQMRAGAEGVLPIYTFGKLTALQEAGRKGVEAGEALRTTAQDEAEYQVAQAYFGYCLAANGLDILSETQKRLDDAKATLERLRKEGSAQVSQLDVYKVDFYRSQLEAQLASAQSSAGYALAAIRLVIAAPPDEHLEIAVERLEERHGALLPIDAYVALATANRPELKAIEAGVEARKQEVVLRQAMYLPDFGIAGFFHWAWTTNTTRQLSPFAYDPYNDLTAGLGLVMRYSFDFPQKGIALEQARAELQKMEHQRDLIVAGVRLQIEKAWFETNAALVRSNKQSVAEKNARRWATAAFTAFDLGTGDTRELVDSFTALAQGGAMRAQAFYDVQIGLRTLSRSVGQQVTLEPEVVAAPPAVLAPK
jgi:outer membrane protein TolC